MRVETGNGYSVANSRARPAALGGGGPGGFTAALATAAANAGRVGGGGAARPDFTSMTRKDLFDWMNSRIRSGEMSLDDSSAFLGMTVKIPAGQDGPDALDDNERVDFLRIVQDGVAAAQARNDGATLRMLRLAIQTMRNGQTVGSMGPTSTHPD